MVLLEISRSGTNTAHALQSSDHSFCLHSKLPSATVNFHLGILLLLGHHLPFPTKVELEVVSGTSRKC